MSMNMSAGIYCGLEWVHTLRCVLYNMSRFKGKYTWNAVFLYLILLTPFYPKKKI